MMTYEIFFMGFSCYSSSRTVTDKETVNVIISSTGMLLCDSADDLI